MLRAQGVRLLPRRLRRVVFPSPYDTISKFTDAKNVVLCDGVLYQVWRRPTGAGNATVAAPTGGVRRWIHIFKGDVFVLRFDPGNWPSSPCWSVVEAICEVTRCSSA